MGLLSCALRLIRPPTEHCPATHRVADELVCDMTHPHTGQHRDYVNGVAWSEIAPPPDDDETGVDW